MATWVTDGHAVYAAWMCWTESWFLTHSGWIRAVWDLLMPLRLACGLKFTSIFFWNFLFHIIGWWLTVGKLKPQKVKPWIKGNDCIVSKYNYDVTKFKIICHTIISSSYFVILEPSSSESLELLCKDMDLCSSPQTIKSVFCTSYWVVNTDVWET